MILEGTPLSLNITSISLRSSSALLYPDINVLLQMWRKSEQCQCTFSIIAFSDMDEDVGVFEVQLGKISCLSYLFQFLSVPDSLGEKTASFFFFRKKNLSTAGTTFVLLF